MNRDVFLSLLALDAYNRGYGQGVFLQDGDNPNGQNETGRLIGNAHVTTQSTVLAGSEARDAGFYAIAYEWNNNGINETVISYRGTNFPDLSNLTSEAAEAAWDDSSARNASLAC